jgi:hypothetical protein
MADRDQARQAKIRLAELLQGVPGINGVGIARVDNGWAIRVNVLIDEGSPTLPAFIDGVPVQRRNLTGRPQAHATSH